MSGFECLVGVSHSRSRELRGHELFGDRGPDDLQGHVKHRGCREVLTLFEPLAYCCVRLQLN